MKYFLFPFIIAVHIFINNRKSRASDHIFYAFYIAKGMDKCRFACSHITMKGKHTRISHDFQNKVAISLILPNEKLNSMEQM